jgi:NADH:ubiquinone oxidoreductase subunit E
MQVQQCVADALDVPLEEVYGVSTFYSNFRLQAIGKHKVSVCMVTACYVRGAGKLVEKLERVLNVKPGKTTDDGLFTLDCTRCIGCCGLAPVITVGDDVYGKTSPEEMEGIVKKYRA